MPDDNSNRKFQPIPQLTESDIQRFERYVNRAPGQGPNGDCWEWIGATRRNAYGQFGVGGRLHKKNLIASRVAYFIYYHEDPGPDDVCHHCDNPRCVRPEHLFRGDRFANMRDAAQKGRTAKGERHGSVTHPDSIPKGTQHWAAEYTDEQVLDMRSRYKNGEFYRTIAEWYGTTVQVVRYIVRIGWAHLDGRVPLSEGRKPVQGERHPDSIMNPDKVRAVRQLRGPEMGVKRLAKMFGVTPTTIRSILQGKTWKSVV